jgi:hypothetical protein
VDLHNFRGREVDTRREGRRVHRREEEGHAAHLRPAAQLRDDEPRGVSLFSLSRRMGTSLEMIDHTYRLLAPGTWHRTRGRSRNDESAPMPLTDRPRMKAIPRRRSVQSIYPECSSRVNGGIGNPGCGPGRISRTRRASVGWLRTRGAFGFVGRVRKYPAVAPPAATSTSAATRSASIRLFLT